MSSGLAQTAHCSKPPLFSPIVKWGSELPRWLSGNESARQCRRRKILGSKDLWRSPWHSTPVFLPGESRGQRSLASYSPWGHRVRHDLATQQQRNWGSAASCSGLRGRRAQPQGSTTESTEVVAVSPMPATACPPPPHSVTRTRLSSLWAKARPSDPAACSARRGHQGQATPRGSPHRPRSHLQPSDTALAGRLAGLESASRAGCPRTGWPWSQRPRNVFQWGSQAQSLCPFPPLFLLDLPGCPAH